MTEQQIDRDHLRENATEGGAWGAVTLDLLDQLEQAEARIEAARDVLDHWRLDDLDLLVPAADIRRALDD